MQAIGYVRISPRPAFECARCGFKVTYAQNYCPECKEITEWKRTKATSLEDYSGGSLNNQISDIKRYCVYKNIELLAIYGDPLVSGKDIKNRPGLRTLLEIADRGVIGGVICAKLDRFARNTVETLESVERLNNKGVAFIIVDQDVDTSTAMGKMFLTITAAYAQMEREQISERTKKALHELKLQGRRISGHAPYGYRFQGKALVKDDREVRAIERILQLEAERVPSNMWGAILFSEGIKSKEGKPYHRSSLWRMRKAMEGKGHE